MNGVDVVVDLLFVGCVLVEVVMDVVLICFVVLCIDVVLIDFDGMMVDIVDDFMVGLNGMFV